MTTEPSIAIWPLTSSCVIGVDVLMPTRPFRNVTSPLRVETSGPFSE